MKRGVPKIVQYSYRAEICSLIEGNAQQKKPVNSLERNYVLQERDPKTETFPTGKHHKSVWEGERDLNSSDTFSVIEKLKCKTERVYTSQTKIHWRQCILVPRTLHRKQVYTQKYTLLQL